MKLIIIAAVLCLAAFATGEEKNNVEILESTYENKGDGNYDFNYKGSDGSARQEHGELRSLESRAEGENKEEGPAKVVVVTGEYSWTSPEGQQFTLKFVSDENGFRPVGDHLPK